MMRPAKPPTKTCTVLETLIGRDDFMTARQLAAETRLGMPVISVTLHHLYRHKAVNCMESDGQLWWYATPDEDDRSHKIDRRSEFIKPRVKPRTLPVRRRNWLTDRPKRGEK